MQTDPVASPVSDLARRFRASRPWRAWIRFANARGLLLARGLAFQALLAAFAALWLAFAILGAWLRSSPTAGKVLADGINALIPRLIDTGDGGVVRLDTLLSVGVLSWTGVLAGIILLWTAVAWFSAAREAVRAVAGLPRRTGNAGRLRRRDAVTSRVFGAAGRASAVLSFSSTGLIGGILGLFGVTGSEATAWLSGAAGLVVSFAIHAVLVYVFLRYLAGMPLRFVDLAQAAVIGAVGFTALDAVAGLIIGRSGSNLLLASFAVVLGLLFWFYLLCTVLLLATAWAVGGKPVEPGGGELSRGRDGLGGRGQAGRGKGGRA